MIRPSCRIPWQTPFVLPSMLFYMLHNNHHVVSSSNVAQFGQQVQLQSTPNQPPQIFSFMDHYHNMSAQSPYKQVSSTYTNFLSQGNIFSLVSL